MLENKTARQSMVLSPVCVLLGMFIFGCGPSHRMAADGTTEIPREWQGDGFPPEAATKSGGVIDFESLYVMSEVSVGDDTRGQFVQYMRFWPNGHVFERVIHLPDMPNIESKETLMAEHGTINDGMLNVSSNGQRYWSTIVGRWRIHDNEIYIELFTYGQEMLDFVTYAGPLTDDGFLLTRVHAQFGLSRRWRNLPQADHYTRQHVGPMKGEPTW